MVNPKLTIGFGDNALRKVKSSKTEAIKTFFTVLDSCTDLKHYNTIFEILNQLNIMNPQSEFYMEHKTAVKHKWIPYACIYMSYASDSSLQNSSGSRFIIKAITRGHIVEIPNLVTLVGCKGYCCFFFCLYIPVIL